MSSVLPRSYVRRKRDILDACLTVALVLSGMLAVLPVQAAPPDGGAGYGAAPVANCRTDLSYLNQVTGWQASWPGEWARIASTPGDAAAQAEALKRWGAAAATLRADQKALESGLAPSTSHTLAPTAVVRRVLQQAKDLHAALVRGDAGFFAAGDGPFARQWRALLQNDIARAIAGYTAFLERRYLPATHEDSALAGLHDGGVCFRNATQWWTTLSLDSDTIDAIGQRLIVDTRQRLAASAGGESFEATLARLRATATTTYAATDAAALIDVSSAALARARERLPEAFDAPPPPLAVVPMQAHMQASFPAGFYQPAESTTDTAAYVINPSRPAERRLMAEVIAFHEGIPGHHLFYSYPRVANDGDFNSGISEGWAIYGEYLADELGLYSTPLDREGMHAKHLWAASRLVIEPRLHSGRWSRREAIDYMRATTALPEAEIEIEIDRYLAMPGQSLSYMLGYDVLRRARERARVALGDRFDLRAFHAFVLEHAHQSLPKIEADVDAWIAEQGHNPHRAARLSAPYASDIFRVLRGQI